MLTPYFVLACVVFPLMSGRETMVHSVSANSDKGGLNPIHGVVFGCGGVVMW